MSNFKTKEEFIGYLEGTLIPDLEESGYTETAKDFKEAVYWLNKGNNLEQETDTTGKTVFICDLRDSTGCFVKSNEYISGVFKSVYDSAMQLNGAVQFGNITGVPIRMFSAIDKERLAKYGYNNTFNI